MIAALNPAVLPDKVAALAGWCNEHDYNHYRFLYASAVVAQESLLHQADEDRLDYVGALVYSNCANHKLQLLAVMFALKALISTSSPPLSGSVSTLPDVMGCR